MDWLRERQIDGARWLLLALCWVWNNSEEWARAAARLHARLIGRRSPAQVERMERAKGLR